MFSRFFREMPEYGNIIRGYVRKQIGNNILFIVRNSVKHLAGKVGRLCDLKCCGFLAPHECLVTKIKRILFFYISRGAGLMPAPRFCITAQNRFFFSRYESPCVASDFCEQKVAAPADPPHPLRAGETFPVWHRAA